MRTMIKAKLFSIFMVTVLLTMIPYNSTAAEGLKLSAAEVKGGVGEQEVIIVKADNAARTEGGQFILTFNPTLIRPVIIEAGELITTARSSVYLGNLEYASGQLMFMWVTVYADTADSGSVCKITFDLLKDGETLLKFSEIVVAPDGIGIAVVASGKVTIGDRLTESEDNKPAAPNTGTDNSVVSDDDSIVNKNSNGESINDTVSDSNISIYIVGFVSLAFVTIIGFIVIRRLKESDRKRKKAR